MISTSCGMYSVIATGSRYFLRVSEILSLCSQVVVKAIFVNVSCRSGTQTWYHRLNLTLAVALKTVEQVSILLDMNKSLMIPVGFSTVISC